MNFGMLLCASTVMAVPTLALIGGQDPNMENVERLAGVMSNLDVVIIPGATHMSAPGEDMFIETLIRFLGEHSQ